MALFGSRDEALSIVIKARDEASKTFDTVNKKVKGMSGGMEIAARATKALAIGITAAAGAAVTFGGFAVKAAMDAEVEMARFNTTMANTPGVTKQATDAILKRAAAAVKLGFDDEEAANVMAKLFQRTGDVDQAMHLAAGAMDLARAKNISLSDAGRMVQLVLSGNARALKEYGIEIDDALPPMEALGVLFKKVGGQAQAFSGTMKGQLEIFQRQWDNFKETVGAQLLPLLTRLLQIITPIAEAFFAMTTAFVTFATSAEQVRAWLDKLLTTIDEKTGLITLFKWAWDQIVGTFRENLMPALAELWEALKPLEPLLSAIGKVLGGMLLGAVYAITLALTGLIQLLTYLVTFAVKVGTAITDFLVTPIMKLIDALGSAIYYVEQLISKFNLLNGLKSAGSKVIKGVGSVLGFEHGGTVPGPVGRPVPVIAHGQETIIPAGRRSSDAGSTYSVVINNPTIRNTGDVQLLRRQIEEALRDVTRGHKLATI